MELASKVIVAEAVLINRSTGSVTSVFKSVFYIIYHLEVIFKACDFIYMYISTCIHASIMKRVQHRFPITTDF